eukprot:m51a1_g3445 hypothetical protein (273) ;mRNA; r:663168-663986
MERMLQGSGHPQWRARAEGGREYRGHELPPLPLDKVRAQVRDRLRGGLRGVVLVQSGSLCPPHAMHLEMFARARAAVERSSPSLVVVGGFMVPSSDGYVFRKLGRDGIALQHRCRMCSIACAESDWIDVCPWGIAAGGDVTRNMDGVLSRTFPGVPLSSVEMHGADTVLRFKAWEKPRKYVVLGRPGYTEQLRERIASAEKVHKRSELFFVDGELEDVSSTQVREAVRAAASPDEIPEVLRHALHPGVAQYMMAVVKGLWEQRGPPRSPGNN